MKFIEVKRTSALSRIEDSDCTVHALAVVTGWPYLRCHRLARETGRKNRRAYPWIHLIDHPEVQRNFKISHTDMGGCGWNGYYPTVTRALKTLTKLDRAVLDCPDHVIGIRGGCVKDTSRHPRMKVWGIYTFTPKHMR